MSLITTILGTIGLILSALALVFMVTTIRSVRADMSEYEVDARHWAMLSTRGTPAIAHINVMSRHAQRLTRAGSHGNNQLAAVDLTVSYADAVGAGHTARIATFIETALLANFTSGGQLPIVFNPAEPTMVAIDRRKVQVEIEPSAR